MKKYSTNAPLIFGIIFLVVGIAAGQIPIILPFGVLPIVASILSKWSDYKAKKQGKETSTERANRIYQEVMNASGKNAQVKKLCCARCGVDLSLIPVRQVKKIGEKNTLKKKEKLRNLVYITGLLKNMLKNYFY